jgi:hypothetical protein
MSVMFTLMRYRPILLSSGATLRRIASRNFSRSWLICSMVSDATVRRSWPKMISRAMLSTSSSLRLSRRSAALFMIVSSVLMPTVKVLGTFTRMFCSDSALVSGIGIVSGVRLMYV